MKVYIVEFSERPSKEWEHLYPAKISQEGYRSLKAAQKFVESRPNVLRKITEMHYETLNGDCYIHDIMIME